jgi:hypothetical protein
MSSRPTRPPELFERFPGLEQLFRGYVAQHAAYTYDGDLEEAVGDFAGLPESTLRSAVDGLAALLALPPDDRERRAALGQSALDNSASPAPEDVLFLAWMHQTPTDALEET